MASAFSGRAGRLAGMWGAEQAQNYFNQSQGRLDQGQTSALAALCQGRTDALSALSAGYAAARPEYQGAIDRLNPYAQAGQSALGMYQNSLGLNGGSGNDAAVGAYRESPGYRYAVDQATDAVARKQSALGMLGSGNTATAISDRAQNLADQDYGRWQGQLSGLSNLGMTASGQQAGIQSQLGNLNAQEGRDRSNIYSNTGTQEAGLHQNFAQLGAANINNLGQTVIGAGTGALMAGQQAAQNRLGAVMGGLQLGASLLAPVLGGGLGSLGGGLARAAPMAINGAGANFLRAV